jgi:hypothetical protein
MNLKEITKELSAKTLCDLLRSYDELGRILGAGQFRDPNNSHSRWRDYGAKA